MLRIVNFRSIIDLKIDFRYGEKSAPRHFEESDSWAFLSGQKGKNDRFVPVMAIYGANASGKSNIINAFLTFTQILQHGIAGCYVPNKLNRKYDHACFEAVVSTDVGRFRYEISYSQGGIQLERAVRILDDGTESMLFEVGADGNCFDGVAAGEYNAERLNAAIRIECVNEQGAKTRPFLACLVRTFPGLSEFAVKIWQEFFTRLQVSARNEFFISQSIDLLAASDTPAAREVAMSKIVKILRKFDFGVKDMTMTRQRIGKSVHPGSHGGLPTFGPGATFRDVGDAWIVDEFKLVHEDARGHRQILDFMTEESDGTKLVAALIGVCLWALENGRTLFVDELDRSLHPFILIALIKLFKSKRYNQSNAQLIFTAHDATPLEDELLRVSEVGIVDKTLVKGTTFRRLSDFGDVRNAINFRRNYLAGSYSGIPFPYI